MPAQYPKIVSFIPYRGHSNGHPKCGLCDQRATGRILVQVNWFRGDDQRLARCDAHKETVFPRP
jgi:hypothetical protein